MEYITYAIPVFFLLIGVEAAVSAIGRKGVYRLNDSINDLSCGVLQQVLGVFSRGIVFGVYILVYQNLRLFDSLPLPTWAAWVLCFLGVDFLYYWFHRISHERNIAWAAHIVHHQSEEYNLTVALRQGAFQPLMSWVFYLPLAIVGFSPEMFITASAFNTIYQFWIHTRLVGRLGPLEWVLNTPSHHRVHHASDPRYIDRNYAGMLIVWDRLFGTFVPEEEEPTYGVTEQLASWNPLWANFHYFRHVARLARTADRWTDRIRIWFMRPGWHPKGRLGDERLVLPADKSDRPKYDARPAPSVARYAFALFVVSIAMTLGLLFARESLTLAAALALATQVIWALVNTGGIMEVRRWAAPSELLRLPAMVSLAWWLAPQLTLPIGTAVSATTALAVVLGAWLLRLRPAMQRAPAPTEPSALAPS